MREGGGKPTKLREQGVTACLLVLERSYCPISVLPLSVEVPPSLPKSVLSPESCTPGLVGTLVGDWEPLLSLCVSQVKVTSWELYLLWGR